MQIHELPSGTPDLDDELPFDTGGANYKAPFSSFEVGENTATFESADEADPQQFKTVDQIETGPIKTILKRLSMAVSNVRFIYSLVQSLLNKTMIINYNSSAGQFSIVHDSNNRIILNKGNEAGTQYTQFLVHVGDASTYINNTAGTFNLTMNSGATHRIYISDGRADSPAQMILRCGNPYIQLDPETNRINIAASGGLFVNGLRNNINSYSGTYTTSAGGNFSIGFSKKSVMLAAYCTRSDTLVIPYPTANTGTAGATTWWFHVQNTNGSAVASTSVTVTVFYMNLE